jgi:hypothetical protein
VAEILLEGLYPEEHPHATPQPDSHGGGYRHGRVARALRGQHPFAPGSKHDLGDRQRSGDRVADSRGRSAWDAWIDRWRSKRNVDLEPGQRSDVVTSSADAASEQHALTAREDFKRDRAVVARRSRSVLRPLSLIPHWRDQ